MDYTITVRIIVDTDLSIHASSLEEALKIAKNKTVLDFVKLKGEYIDGAYQLTGIYNTRNEEGETIEKGVYYKSGGVSFLI